MKSSRVIADAMAAIEDGAAYLPVECNTPGGELDCQGQLVRALQQPGAEHPVDLDCGPDDRPRYGIDTGHIAAECKCRTLAARRIPGVNQVRTQRR
jgi:hypothetical protein